MYNYFNLEPSKTEVPVNMRYICISKEYPEPKPKDGRKRCTKEQLKEYNDVMFKRAAMFKKLDSGNVIDMGNNYLVMNDVLSEIRHHINNDNYFLYKIKPINAKKIHKNYSYPEEFQVSSFTVERKIESITELIDDFVNERLIRKFYGHIFDYGHYNNEGNKEFTIKMFEYLKQNYPDTIIYVSDCIMEDPYDYKDTLRYKNSESARKLGELLLEKGLISLCKNPQTDYEDYCKLLNNLIRAGWYKVACDLIDYVGTELNYFVGIDKNEEVMSTIRANTDNIYVYKIIERLSIEDSYITILVKQPYDDGYAENIIEKKQFKNINEAREYVIKTYDVSFEDAAKDIRYWKNAKKEIWFQIA